MLFVYLTICFFLGSFPSAHIVSSLQGVDIKRTGSGNAGATNVLRSVGWKSGLIVMILDIAKGIAPFFIYPYFSVGEALLPF